MRGKYNLIEVYNIICHLAQKINAPESLLPSLNATRDGAYLDAYGADIAYVIQERGTVIFERIAYDSDDEREKNMDSLLYSVFQDITFEMAVKYEFANRTKGRDPRRILFSKQEELLAQLRIDWRDQRELEHKAILKINPFKD